MSRTSSKQQPLSERLSKLRETIGELKGMIEGATRVVGLNVPRGITATFRQVQDELRRAINEASDLEIRLCQFQSLAHTSAMINSSLELEAVLNEVIDNIVSLTGAERAYLVLYNEETGQMEFKVARNLDRETIAQSSFEISRSIVREVASTGEPVVTTDAQADPRFSHQESVIGYSLRSILCVPLKRRNETIGVIYADNRIQTNTFTERDLDLMQAFANQAAIAIENARMFDQVRADLETARKEVEALRIKIDEESRKKKVEEIAATDYFRILQMRARELRKRRREEDKGEE